MAASARAIVLDRSSSLAYSWRAMLQFFSKEEAVRWDEALMNLRRAHDLNPNDCRTLTCLAFGEAFAGNPRLAIEYLNQVARISPRDPWTFNADNVRCMAHFLAGEYDACIEWARAANSAAASLPQPEQFMAMAYAALGDATEARAALERARRLAPEYIQAILDGLRSGVFLYSLGPRQDADRLRSRLCLRIAAGLEDPIASAALR
jgi:tetratricopeptide (TPR) repeat protein